MTSSTSILDHCKFPSNCRSQHQRFRVPSKKLEQIRESQLHTLTVFHQLAQQQSMVYSLHGGSLIGFYWTGNCIPWDDDIDIIMRKKDFDYIHGLWKTGTPQKLKFPSGFNTSKTRRIELFGETFDLAKSWSDSSPKLFKLISPQHAHLKKVPGGIDLIYCGETEDGKL